MDEKQEFMDLLKDKKKRKILLEALENESNKKQLEKFEFMTGISFDEAVLLLEHGDLVVKKINTNRRLVCCNCNSNHKLSLKFSKFNKTELKKKFKRIYSRL